MSVQPPSAEEVDWEVDSSPGSCEMSQPPQKNMSSNQQEIVDVLKGRVLAYMHESYPGSAHVTVTPVGSDCYRINLYGREMFGGRMVDSWFVKVSKRRASGSSWKLSINVHAATVASHKDVKDTLDKPYVRSAETVTA